MKILKDKHVEGMVKIYSSCAKSRHALLWDYVEGVTLRRAVDDHLLKSLNKKLEVILSIAYIIHKAHGTGGMYSAPGSEAGKCNAAGLYYENSEDAIPVVILDFDLSRIKAQRS